MKKIILLTALLISALVIKAQVALYTFSQSSGTYTAITGGSQILNENNMNEKVSAAITIPSFTYNGVAYTTAYVTSNGILSFGTPAPAANEHNGISDNTGSGKTLCPFSDHLERAANDGNSEVRYQQVGNELVFQWKRVKRAGESENFDFQVRLNLINGIIKFVYNMNSGPANDGSYPEVGIRSSSSDYNNRRVGTGAENWATSLAGTANTSTVRFTSNSPAKTFVDGQTYTWTPPGQCSGSPTGGTAAATTTTGACPAGSNLSLSGNTSGLGITYQWQSSPDGSSWTNIAGATATTYSLASVLVTTQYRCNVTCFNSSLTTASSSVTVNRTGPAAPTFISNASVCTGALPATISVTSVSGCTVDWYNASSGPSLLQSGSATYAANLAGTYYAQSRNTTNGCLSTSRTGVILTVNPIVTPSVTISTPSATSCQNSLVVYTAAPVNGGGSPVYQWKVNGSNVGTGASTFSYRPVNGDNVSCILTSNASCATISTATSNNLTVSLVTPSTVGIANGDMVWTGSSSASWTDVANWLVYAGGTTFNVPAMKPTSSDNVIIENNGTCFSTIPDVPGAQACKNLTITAGNSLTMVGTASLDVYGSWSNLGTFTAGSSTINFKGSQVQQIASGGNPFYNVTFNNTSVNAQSINISAPMTVTGTATFASGVAYFTGSGSLTFTDNAASNGGSTASFVAGPVIKSGNDAFVFPVGKIDPSNTKIWAPLGISNPTSLTDAFTCEYFYSASFNNLDPASMCDYNQLKATSGVEFWDLNRTIGVSTPTVTLYWKDAVRTGITDPNDLTVAHLENCGGTPKWKAMSSTLNGITGTTGSITGTGFTSFSPITFGSKNGVNPLPVTLLSFTADCDNGKPVITWETASETDNAYFNLERSMDATNWEVAGTVKGAGNSNQKLEYRFVDENAASGTIYYRLKQYDNDGDVEGFGMIKTDCGKFTEQSSVFYYPNPFTENLSLEISNIAARKAHVVIYDILGTEVASWTLNSDDIQNKTYQLNPGNLPKGIYYVEFNSDTYSGTTKLVKK